MLRSECCNYSVGPWVSGSGRETALARGNPVKRRNFNLRFSNFDCFDVSVFNRQSKIDIRKYKMPIRYGRFEMPKTLSKDESTATDTYAKFTAEPFEAGYGHTVGNSLRRVLLSSLEGAAITAVKITGAQSQADHLYSGQEAQIRRRARRACRSRFCQRRGKQASRPADRYHSNRLDLFVGYPRQVCGRKHSCRPAY